MSREKNDKEQLVLKYLQKEYSENSQFYNFLGINIDKAYNGHAVQSMLVEKDKHTNLYGNAQGGVIMTIADSCMSVAGGSLGKRIVTLSNSINFMRNVHAPAKIICEAVVIHNGRQTITMKAKVFDENNRILSIMDGTFYVIGIFEEIAEIMQRPE